MLLELTVENLAVVERVHVRWHAGLNLLTGETGSGKSIVVDALGLLFGGRASSDLVRSGADRARVTGIFEVPAKGPLRVHLDQAGIETEEGELLLEREVLANGKSRAFAAGRPVTAGLLRELAPLLGDIHGQHEQQNLAEAETQRHMLDSFGGLSALVDAAGVAYRAWLAVQDELHALDQAEQAKLRMADLWAFQCREIEAASLTAGEEGRLEEERRKLKNVTRLEETAGGAFELLYEAKDSVAAHLRMAMKRLEEAARLDAALEGLPAALEPARLAVEDVVFSLRDYLGRLEADPARLDAVENRLAGIDKLKRKYGGSVEEILAFLDTVRGQLQAVETAEERRAALAQQSEKLAGAYREAALRLTEKRREAASALAKKMEAELATLAMRSVFRVDVREAAWSELGSDAVEFLVSANVGEAPKPLDKVASGGELSRLALALKAITVGSAPGGRTLVFDEVDTGVGGSVAEAIGRKLKKISGRDQVLCVTHLPQVASFADHHFSVAKRTEKGRTYTVITELDAAGRTQEIGRMLSGEKLTPEALKHAEKMIRASA
jgi:DNA repair protein RecN (Recombination protein N)